MTAKPEDVAIIKAEWSKKSPFSLAGKLFGSRVSYAIKCGSCGTLYTAKVYLQVPCAPCTNCKISNLVE